MWVGSISVGQIGTIIIDTMIASASRLVIVVTLDFPWPSNEVLEAEAIIL